MTLDGYRTVKDRAQDTYKAVQEIIATLGLRVLAKPLVVAKYLVEQDVLDARHAEIMAGELMTDHERLRQHIGHVSEFQQKWYAASTDSANPGGK